MLRSDGSGEYISKSFAKFMHEKGMVHQKTQPHTPHQMVWLRVKNRLILEMARSLAIGCHLPIALWVEAINTTIYLLNQSSARADHGTTPYERLFLYIPSVDHLRIFGCLVYTLVTANTRKKWDDKVVKFVLLGYNETTKGYRAYNPMSKHTWTSKDVKFDETCFPLSPSIVTSNHELDSDGVAWPADYLPKLMNLSQIPRFLLNLVTIQYMTPLRIQIHAFHLTHLS